MREIKNNVEIGKVQKLDSKAIKPEKQEPQAIIEAEEKQVSDFSNPKAETLGRSQVAKLDNISSDVAFAAVNPEVVEASDKLFKVAYSQLKASGATDENAYYQASAIATSSEARDLLSK